MTFRGGRERRVAEWTIRRDQNGRQLGGHRRGPGRRPLERKWTFLNSFRESGKTMSGKVWRMVSLPFGQKMAGQKIAQYLIRLYRFQQGGGPELQGMLCPKELHQLQCFYINLLNLSYLQVDILQF